MDAAQTASFFRLARPLLIAFAIVATLPWVVMAVAMATACVPMMQMMPGMQMPGGMMR